MHEYEIAINPGSLATYVNEGVDVLSQFYCNFILLAKFYVYFRVSIM